VNADNRDPLAVFMPSGLRGRIATGTTVLDAARLLGVDLDSVCGGRGMCTRCQVEIATGDFAKLGIASGTASVSGESDREQRQRDRSRLADKRRLGCQAEIRADVVIHVPAESQMHHQVVRKPHEAHDIELNPVVHAYYVEVAQPALDVSSGDLERTIEALNEQWGLSDLVTESACVPQLQSALREGHWKVTVAVRDNERIVAAWPGLRTRLWGVAVDVGSTTIACQLCDLVTGEVIAGTGAMNPQIRFGEDLMSRVSWVMMNPGGATEMTAAVRSAVNDQIAKLVAAADGTPADVVELTFVGNPVMHHLLLGLDPVPLGTAPFALATDRPVDTPARALDIDAHGAARAWVLPCIAGHVGADTAAVLLAEAPWEREEISLIVDVGTNAEIVIGNRDRLLAASSPTGPAFEGAQITSGQRAAPGAIERVRIDTQTLEPRFRIIGNDAWSTEDAFAGAVATGICGSGIIEAIASMFLAGIISRDGVIQGSLADRSERIVADGRTWSYVLQRGTPDIVITQNDVRAIQLAKAALYAGARLLMDHIGCAKVDRIRLAGAFGSHIDVQYAMVLGMIPDCVLDRVTSAGNAAGTGARIALLDARSRIEISRRTRQIEKIETAVEPRFQEHFVAAMAFPHQSDAFPELSRTVHLPEIAPEASAPGKKRRRARKKQRP
jgi:uncharacterized 2Fe-2S/4Fe-4S cluster protein (DUF4445 family)